MKVSVGSGSNVTKVSISTGANVAFAPATDRDPTAKITLSSGGGGGAEGRLAYDQANAAYNAANSRVLKAGDVMTGELNVAALITTQNISPDLNVTYNIGSNDKRYDAIYGNTVWVGDAELTSNGSTIKVSGVEIQGSNIIVDISGSYAQANGAYAQANGAYVQANGAYAQANGAYEQANGAYAQANLAYSQANNAYDSSNNRVLKTGDTMTGLLTINYDGVGLNVNSQAIFGNAVTVGNSNTGIFLLDDVNGFASIELGGAVGGYIDFKMPVDDDYDFRIYNQNGETQFISASADQKVRFTGANVSFDTDTLFVDIINRKVGVGTNTPDANLTVVGNANIPTINSITVNATNFITSAGLDVTTQANNARDQANNAYDQANAAYNDANTRVLRAGDTMTGNLNVAAFLITQNVIPAENNTFSLGSPEFKFKDLYVGGNTVYIGDAILSSEGSEVRTNTFNATVSFVSGGLNVLNQANAAYDAANSAGINAINAYNQANTARTTANDAYSQANTARDQANSAYTQANNAYAEANLKLNLTGGTINGSLNVSGNLAITGNTTYYNVTTYSVDDPLIYLAANNDTSDLVDIGFMGGKNTAGQYNHTGLVRDAGDATWYLFDNLLDEGHVNNVVDFANTTLATLRANIAANSIMLMGNVVATQANLTITYDQANNARDQANTARDQANTARGTANDAYGAANTANINALNAYGQANTARDQANTARNTANDAYSQANTARNQANTARTTANDSYAQANTARNTANDSYGQANTARNTANGAYAQANGAYAQANGAYEQANGAYAQANGAYTQANGAYAQANGAYAQANLAYGQANAAYDAANNRVLRSGDTITGTLNVASSIVSQNIEPNLNLTYDIGSSSNLYNKVFANSILIGGLSGATLTSNGPVLVVSGVEIDGSGNLIAAFDAYNQANAARDTANSAYSQSNLSYNQANSAYNEANLKLNISGGTITGNLVISGNLEVLGNSTTLNVETLSVEDNEIILNSNVTGSPVLDAFISINRGSSNDAQLKWDENDDQWKWNNGDNIFYSFNSALDSYAQANLAYNQANNARDQANVARTTANDAYAAANTANTNALNAYLQANTARDNANDAYDQANTARDTANDAYSAANTANTNALNSYEQANTARDTANNAYETANNASNNATVRISANSGSVITSQNINFINTSTVTVSVVSGDSGNANVSFSSSGVGVEYTYNTTTTSIETVDSWSASSYRSGKYQMQVENVYGFYALDLMILHDGATTNLIKYGETTFGGATGTFSSDIFGGNVRLRFTATDPTSQLTYYRSLLTARGTESLPLDLMTGDLIYDLMLNIPLNPSDLAA